MSQSLICWDVTSAAEDLSTESSIFLEKYTFHPKQRYGFAGNLYPALSIKEPDVEYVVKSLKTIDLSSETTDQIIKLYGPVHEKSTKGGTHEWKYNFLFSRELNSQQKSDLERLTQEYQKISLIVVDKKANLQVQKEHERYPELGIIDKERIDPSAIFSLEEKMKAINEKTMAIELTQKQTLVQIIFKIGTTGKIMNIDLNKITDDGTTSCLYTKGGDGQDNISSQSNPKTHSDNDAALPVAPANPYPGKIYLNTTDKHFYGWDGTSWLKLDTKP